MCHSVHYNQYNQKVKNEFMVNAYWHTFDVFNSFKMNVIQLRVVYD